MEATWGSMEGAWTQWGCSRESPLGYSAGELERWDIGGARYCGESRGVEQNQEETRHAVREPQGDPAQEREDQREHVWCLFSMSNGASAVNAFSRPHMRSPFDADLHWLLQPDRRSD